VLDCFNPTRGGKMIYSTKTALSEQQLVVWSNAPSSTKIQYTHEQVRKAIEKSDALRCRNFEIFLQGSYANSTNIRLDSDVDIVVQLNSSFNHDLSRLPSEQQHTFHQTYSGATYYWTDFRQDVINALNAYFGTSAVTLGNKSIKIKGNDYRVTADVVPCIEFRQYQSFNTWKHDDFIKGMKFWTVNEMPNKEIINFPKMHIENGEDKNANDRTGAMYKKLIRVVKNIRKQLVDQNYLDPKIAPSYFLECIIYNVPDSYFRPDFKSSLGNALDFIIRRCQPATLLTVSHQHLLFGDKPWQWNTPNAATFFQMIENNYTLS
jgi:hypothetical protein